MGQILQPFRAVTLRIKRHEKDLDPLRIAPEHLHHISQLRQHGRTNIGAGRIAEEHHRRLALKISE